MSLTLLNNFEEGSNGTTLIGGSGGNTAGTNENYLDSVNIGTGNTLIFDNTHVAHGTLACKVATGSGGGAAYCSWIASLGTQTVQTWFETYLYFPANPVAGLQCVVYVPGSGTSFNVRVTTGGLIQLYNSTTLLLSFTNAVALNQWVRIEGYCVPNTSTGSVSCSLYNSADSTTATETHTISSLNTGSSITAVRFGQYNNIANNGPFWIDNIGVSTVGALGPASTSFAGTLSMSGTGAVSLAGTHGFTGTGYSLRQAGPIVTGTGSVTPTLPIASVAKSLLVSGLATKGGSLSTPTPWVHVKGQPTGGGATSKAALFVGATVSTSADRTKTGNTLADFQWASGIIGGTAGLGCDKYFYGTLPSSFVNEKGYSLPAGVLPIICYKTQNTNVVSYCNSVNRDIWLIYYQEPEGNFTNGSTFVSQFKTQSDLIHGVGNSHIKVVMCAGGYNYRDYAGNAINLDALKGNYLRGLGNISPVSGKPYAEIMAHDCYQGSGDWDWPTNGLANFPIWLNWLALVTGANVATDSTARAAGMVVGTERPLAVTEYGIHEGWSGYTPAGRGARIQLDINYLMSNAFLSTTSFPLQAFSYWWLNNAIPSQFQDAATETYYGTVCSGSGAAGRAAVKYVPGNAGGITSATFTSDNPTDFCVGQMLEFTGAAGAVQLVDSFGAAAAGSAGSLAVSESSPSSSSDVEIGLFVNAYASIVSGKSFGTPSGLTQDGQRNSQLLNFWLGHNVNAAGGTLSATSTYTDSTMAGWAGVLATFTQLTTGRGNLAMSGSGQLTAGASGLSPTTGMLSLSGEGVLTTRPGVVGGPPAPLPGQLPVIPVQFPTPQYVYVATDLVTNELLGELPVSVQSLDCQLNAAGNMTASGNLSDPRIADEDFIARTTPGRTAFWAYRDNQIVWGGIVWTRAWVTVGKQFTLTGQTFESYAARRYPWSWLGSSVFTFNQSPQCFIIDQLWKELQSVKYGNIGVKPVVSLPAKDILRDVTLEGFDLSTSVDSVISNLTSLIDGPDYTIAWSVDSNGLPRKQLVVAPKIGNAINVTNLVVDYPGSVADYTYTEDASSGADTWYVPGSGSASSMPVGIAIDNTILGSGWPLIEGVDTDNSSVTSTGLLDSYASADMSHARMPKVTHSADLFGGGEPKFGSYGLGDYITVNVIDPRFPNGQKFEIRVVGWTITPPDSGSGVEQIALVYDTSA